MEDTALRVSPSPAAEMAGRLLALRADLARVHDWLATTWPDDLPAPQATSASYSGGRLVGLAVHCYDADDFRAAVRLLVAAVGEVEKDPSDTLMRVVGRFGEVEIRVIGDRDQVCTRTQVGTVKEMRPDPEAPQVEVEVPVFAWDCEPVLDDERAAARS